MRDFFIGLIVGVFLTAATGWYFLMGRHYAPIRRTWDIVDAKLTAWHLRPEDIYQELSATGRVVRRQAREFRAAFADTSTDAMITAKIKAKLIADPELSGLSISVNTTDGHVTLAGRVSTHQHVGRAMLLALETDGVKDVTSTLQVKK